MTGFVVQSHIYENYYIQWLLLVFLVIFSASLPGSDDLTRLMETVLYSQMFYAIFQFCA